MTTTSPEKPSTWPYHVLLWGLLVTVPAAKSWQVIAEDPIIGDRARQAMIAAVVVIAVLVVVVEAKPFEKGEPGAVERSFITLGLWADPERPDDDSYAVARWLLAVLGAGAAIVAATSEIESWARWTLAAIAVGSLVALTIVEAARGRRGPVLDERNRRRRAALWVATPIVLSGAGAAIALALRGEDGHLGGERLFDLLVITVLGEELIFRGGLLPLSYRVLPSRVAELVTALSFGAWHFGDAWNDSRGDVPGARALQIGGAIALTFVGGLVFSFLRRRSGTLLGPVFGHVATNLPGIALRAPV